ncbi:MAG: hypothetical protein JWP89_6468 [Schlesneria sp.]|nr:hypothetical protein [Schlesneria sp.]
MRACHLVLTALIMIGPSCAWAETWTSADGILSVESPDAARFHVIPTPPTPFLIIWKSDDEETMMGIVKADIPGGVGLIQDSMEEGLSKEIGAPVRRLPSKQLSGHEVWTMAANAPVGNVTQSIVRHNDVVYKLMVVTQPDSPDIGNINRFLNSLTITPPPGEARPAHTNPGGGVDVNKLSGQVGAFGIFLGIGLVIYQVFLRKKTAPPGQ